MDKEEKEEKSVGAIIGYVICSLVILAFLYWYFIREPSYDNPSPIYNNVPSVSYEASKELSLFTIFNSMDGMGPYGRTGDTNFGWNYRHPENLWRNTHG